MQAAWLGVGVQSARLEGVPSQYSGAGRASSASCGDPWFSGFRDEDDPEGVRSTGARPARGSESTGLGQEPGTC